MGNEQTLVPGVVSGTQNRYTVDRRTDDNSCKIKVYGVGRSSPFLGTTRFDDDLFQEVKIPGSAPRVTLLQVIS